MIDVLPKTGRVEPGQTRPALNQDSNGCGRSAERTQLGNAMTVTGDGEPLAPSDSLDNFAAVIAEVSDGHFSHGPHCITRETPVGLLSEELAITALVVRRHLPP